MLDLAYRTIQTFLAKDRNGYLSPTDFNTFAFQVVDVIYREYFEEENRDKNRANKGLTNQGYSNLAFNQRQRIDHFAAMSTVSYNGSTLRYDLPSDLYLIEDDGVLSSTNKVIEEVQRHKKGYLRNSISASSVTYPTYELVGSSLVVSPSSIVTDISVSYLRVPLKPNWTYQVVNGDALYDPSNPSFQDLDLHASEFSNFVIRMVANFGINIKDYDVTQIAESLKQQMQLKDNS